MSRVVAQTDLDTTVEHALRQHLSTADVPGRELTRIREALIAILSAANGDATTAEGRFMDMLSESVDRAVAKLGAAN